MCCGSAGDARKSQHAYKCERIILKGKIQPEIWISKKTIDEKDAKERCKDTAKISIRIPCNRNDADNVKQSNISRVLGNEKKQNKCQPGCKEEQANCNR